MSETATQTAVEASAAVTSGAVADELHQIALKKANGECNVE